MRAREISARQKQHWGELNGRILAWKNEGLDACERLRARAQNGVQRGGRRGDARQDTHAHARLHKDRGAVHRPRGTSAVYLLYLTLRFVYFGQHLSRRLAGQVVRCSACFLDNLTAFKDTALACRRANSDGTRQQRMQGCGMWTQARSRRGSST